MPHIQPHARGTDNLLLARPQWFDVLVGICDAPKSATVDTALRGDAIEAGTALLRYFSPIVRQAPAPLCTHAAPACPLPPRALSALPPHAHLSLYQLGAKAPALMGSVWTLLTSNMEVYKAAYVDMTDELEPVVDEDGNVLGFETLFYRCFDFIETVLVKKKLRPMIKQNLAGLLNVLVFYMQMTEEQVRAAVAARFRPGVCTRREKKSRLAPPCL